MEQCSSISDGSWASNLMLRDVTANSFFVEWDEDPVGGDGYVVQFLMEGFTSYTIAVVSTWRRAAYVIVEAHNDRVLLFIVDSFFLLTLFFVDSFFC